MAVHMHREMTVMIYIPNPLSSVCERKESKVGGLIKISNMFH